MRRRRSSGAALRVGWVAASTLGTQRPRFGSLPPNVGMRIANPAHWLDAHAPGVRNEMYRADRRYDAVVFVKAMDPPAQLEAERARSRGAKVVFDANVNYYEVWGEYELPGTRPTDAQHRDASAMTGLADWVVADSSYLLDVVRKVNGRASWIPDNVDTRQFRPPRRGPSERPLRLVWCGMATKALPLLDIRDALARLDDAELLVVSNAPPPELAELGRAIPTRYKPFELRRYARILRDCHVIISPKRLVNGYEMGHSEWKITLGMATGLPAVASPQRSYVEAIEHRGGGFVADGPEVWGEALRRLSEDVDLRRELGDRAAQTVRERYATDVVAPRYLELFQSIA
jgi:glycosyltransferase involved in cell wall biosynthesis